MILAVLVVTQLLFAIDTTVVTVALPRIGAELGLDVVDQSWLSTAYVVTFGGLLLLGGRIGDAVGRRRALVVGVALFTAASLAGGLAPSGGWLIGCRAVQGAGAALASPNVMALLMATHPTGPARNRALAVFSAVLGSGAILGLILGGVLTTAAGWRWGLLLNVPVGLAAVLAATRALPESERITGPLDGPGVATSATGIAALVFGLTHAAEDGWTAPVTAAALGAAVVLLAVFVVIERRAPRPVLPLRLLRGGGVGYLAAMLACAAMFGTFFLLTQFQQEVLRFDPLAAGLGFLPLMGSQVLTARLVPSLLRRVPPHVLVVIGAVLVVAGDLWLSHLSAGSGWVTGLAGPMLLIGTGGGCTFAPLSSMILADVRPEDAGAAAGALQVGQYTGTALGVAGLVGVFATARSGGADLAGALALAMLAAAPFAAVAGACGARARKSLLQQR